MTDQEQNTQQKDTPPWKLISYGLMTFCAIVGIVGGLLAKDTTAVGFGLIVSLGG